MSLLPMVFTIFNLIELVSSKYEEGEIKTSEKWAFIARFCFLSEYGQFEYSFQYEKTTTPINLLLYYDSDHQWPAVYKSNKTCEQREAVLDRKLNQIITLKKDDFGSGCSEALSSNNRTITVTCHHMRKFHSSRERWWFIAVSNCNSTKGLSLRYRLLMTNGQEGDYWHEHFSADEFYILPVLTCFCIVYMLLVLATIMCALELKSRQLYHTTYKLFEASVFLQITGIFIQSIAYVRYAVDGVGIAKLRNLGRICESASEVAFLLLLLLMAKGYTITRGRLRLSSSVKLTIFMCVYVIMYITLFIYEQLFFDPGEVLYLYESPAGYGVVLVRIIAWWMFIYSTIFTLKHYPEKSSFYYPFNLVGTMWFVAGPAFILAANTLIDKWVRESIVCAVQHFITLAGHILFLILTVPNKANKNFPYHVRTTQIGIMEVTNGISGNNTMDHFGHHPYAPGGPTFPVPWSRVPTELFTITSPTQRTHPSRMDRRFKIQESLNERPFTPENLIIRPEEILPVSNGAGAHLRNTRLKSTGQPVDENDNERDHRLHTLNNSLSNSLTLESLPNQNSTLESRPKSTRITNGISPSLINTPLGVGLPPVLADPHDNIEENKLRSEINIEKTLYIKKQTDSNRTIYEWDEIYLSKGSAGEIVSPKSSQDDDSIIINTPTTSNLKQLLGEVSSPKNIVKLTPSSDIKKPFDVTSEQKESPIKDTKENLSVLNHITDESPKREMQVTNEKELLEPSLNEEFSVPSPRERKPSIFKPEV